MNERTTVHHLKPSFADSAWKSSCDRGKKSSLDLGNEWKAVSSLCADIFEPLVSEAVFMWQLYTKFNKGLVGFIPCTVA